MIESVEIGKLYKIINRFGYTGELNKSTRTRPLYTFKGGEIILILQTNIQWKYPNYILFYGNHPPKRVKFLYKDYIGYATEDKFIIAGNSNDNIEEIK